MRREGSVIKNVVCLIYQASTGLSQQQQTQDRLIATDGTLNLLDAMNLLRHSVETNDLLAATGQPDLHN